LEGFRKAVSRSVHVGGKVTAGVSGFTGRSASFALVRLIRVPAVERITVDHGIRNGVRLIRDLTVEQTIGISGTDYYRGAQASRVKWRDHRALCDSAAPSAVMLRSGCASNNAYPFFPKSTFGASRAPGFVTSKYSRGLAPTTLAVTTVGKRRMYALYCCTAWL